MKRSMRMVCFLSGLFLSLQTLLPAPGTLASTATPAPAHAPRFSDIQGSYAEDAIDSLTSANVLAGYADGTFRPQQSMNREEFAVVLVRTLHLTLPDGEMHTFPDVDDWARPYVVALVNAGIAAGLDDHTFGAHQSVNREQFVALVVKALGYEQGAKVCDFGVDFRDRSDISEWALPYIGFAEKLGLLDWVAKSTPADPNAFHPDWSIQRQDVAYVMSRLQAQGDSYRKTADMYVQTYQQQPVTITQVDMETRQDGHFRHPDLAALERSLRTGPLLAEILQETPLTCPHPFSLAYQSAPEPTLYVADNQEGQIYTIRERTGALLHVITPSDPPDSALRGIAATADSALYLYYADGTILRIRTDGTVLERFQSSCTGGQSLVFHDGGLYILDPYGHVTRIDATTHQQTAAFALRDANGQPFSAFSTYALVWDGKHYLLANARDDWNLYEYDDQFRYLRTVTSNQWNVTGLAYDGTYMHMINSDTRNHITFRIVDDIGYDVAQPTTRHYQFVDTLFSTTNIRQAFPAYPDKNVLLVYNDSVQATEDYLKPYVSFLDPRGKRIDTMFDSFVYLPSIQLNQYQFLDSLNDTLWSKYLDKTIHDLSALDREWGNRNLDLNRHDRAHVYIAVPYPSQSATLQTREQLVDRYVQNAIEAFQQAQFRNLELTGFYWYREYAERGEPLVMQFTQTVHRYGLKAMWIPFHSYNQGTDYMELDVTNDHSLLGFDEVFEQPNYFFDPPYGSQNLNRFFSIGWTGPLYKKAVEIEMSTALLNDTSGKHKQYLYDTFHAGLQFGFLAGSKAWYEEGQIRRAYRKNYDLYRIIHDALNGNYSDSTVPILQPTDGSLTTSKTLQLPWNCKLRFDLFASGPVDIATLIIHTDDPYRPRAEFTGTFRPDEELVYRHGTLVKQDIGMSPDGLRIGFNIPLDTPVHVVVLPKGAQP
jgi:hypothetical protein